MYSRTATKTAGGVIAFTRPNWSPNIPRALRKISPVNRPPLCIAAPCWPSPRWRRLPTYRKCPPIQRLLRA